MDLLPYYQPYTFPQSQKLLIYLLSITSVPLISILLIRLSDRLRFLRLLSNKLLNAVLIALAVIVIYKGFASLILYRDIFSIDPVIYHPAFMLIFFLGLAILAYCYRFTELIKQLLRFLKPGQKKSLILTLIAVLLIIITLFDRTMDEKNVFIGRTFQYVHSAVFVAPVHDILKGKVLLVDTDSQYGILLNYLPALIFKLLSPFAPLNFSNFFYLMIVYGIVYYLFIYLLLKFRFQSVLWAVIGLITLFTLHFYASLDRYLRPMVFPIRYLLDMPFFFLLLRNSGFLPFYLAFAVFYNFETGISLSVAYLSYVFLENFKSTGNILTALIKSVRKVILIISALVFIALVFSLYAKSVTGQFPDWSKALFYLKLFGLGFISSESAPIGFYLIPLGIYLVFLARILYSLLNKSYPPFFSWTSSLAVYGIMLFIYYVERSYVLNLSTLSIPAIILGLILFRETYSKFRLFGPYLVLGSFIVFSSIYYPYRLITNRNYPYWKGDKKASQDLYNKIVNSSEAINIYQPDDKQVVVFSFYETLILLKSGKINALPYSSVQNIFTTSQVNEIFQNLKKFNPRYIYADSDPWLATNIYPEVFDYIHQNYRLLGTRGILNIWQNTTLQVEYNHSGVNKSDVILNEVKDL